MSLSPNWWRGFQLTVRYPAGCAGKRHGTEVSFRIIGKVREERLVNGERPRRRQPDRVAAGRGLGDRRGADVAAGPGLVLDNETLSEQARHLVGQDARHGVARIPGRRGDD